MGGGAGGSGTGGATGSDAVVTLEPFATSDVTCDPIDTGGNVLAGAIVVTAESSDPTILSVAPSTLLSAHAIQLCGWAPGSVTITVRGAGKTATFRVTVRSAP